MNVVMPAAPIPPPFERCEGRRFTFYPPILGIASNDWTYRRSTWSEIEVRNVATGFDLLVPRRFLGEASEAEDPAIVVSLSEQLEYREGAVRPYRNRVIEMPVGGIEAPPSVRGPQHRASVVSIRLEAGNGSRASRVMGGAVALGVVGCLALVGYSLQGGPAHRRAVITSLDRTYLTLNSSADYTRVVEALGVPEGNRWVITPDGRRLRLLEYPDRGFRAVIMPLAGGERYIGSVDDEGRILQAVLMPDGEPSSLLLRGLEEF